MSGYRRFVTYLYYYENGQKKENCGFAKVEVRQEKFRVEIQINRRKRGTSSVYLFARKNDRPEGALLGDLVVENGSGRAVFVRDTQGVGDTPYGMDDMRGIYIGKPGQEFIASQWDDVDTDWNGFVPWEEEEPEYYDDPAEEEEDTVAVEDAAERQTPEDEETLAETKTEELSSPQSELKSTQMGSSAPIQQNLVSAWEKQWEQFRMTHLVFHPFDEENKIWGVKMDLRDFKVIPQQYRNLANNSFLLHGFFNYHYILFGYEEENEDERRWFVGVPGIYQNQERMLAGIFGFPEFRTKQICVQKTGEFGYWYRYLEL